MLAVILPAAGRSLRFGENKLLANLLGKPVITRAVEAFLCRADVATVMVATNDQQLLQDLLPKDPRIQFCPGGEHRARTVQIALRQLAPGIEWVAIHDGARPLVSQSVIDRTLAAAHKHGAAVPALPVHLTIKQASGPLPAPVDRTIPRQTLWAMQTPQIIRRRHLENAYANCPLSLDQITDDCQLIELAGGQPWLVEGEEKNLKITTPLDLKLAEFYVSAASTVIDS